LDRCSSDPFRAWIAAQWWCRLKQSGKARVVQYDPADNLNRSGKSNEFSTKSALADRFPQCPSIGLSEMTA